MCEIKISSKVTDKGAKKYHIKLKIRGINRHFTFTVLEESKVTIISPSEVRLKEVLSENCIEELHALLLGRYKREIRMRNIFKEKSIEKSV